jgi:hypothetical protein
VPHHFKHFVSFYSYFFDMRKILIAAASFERVEEVDEDPITPLQCSI